MRPLDLDVLDVVSLTGCHVEGGRLHDHLTGEAHQVNPSGLRVLARLDGRQPFGEVEAEASAGEVRAFVAVLERAGLIRVRRRWLPRLHPVAAPAFPRSTRRRWPATVGGVAAGVGWCGRGLLIVAALLAGGLAVLVPTPAALVPVALVLVGLLSTVAHELGHVAAIRATGGQAVAVSAVAGRVVVAHRCGGRRQLRTVAVAGPVAGALAAGLLSTMAVMLFPAGAGLSLTTGVMLAGGHLASLIPVFDDGRHLWGRPGD